MKEYKVDITKEALSDMEAIYEYIANELLAPEYAIGQYNRIANAILKLSDFPEKYRVMRSETERLREIRRMVVDNYSVFYLIRGDRIIVTSVLYSASDIEARLLEE